MSICLIFWLYSYMYVYFLFPVCSAHHNLNKDGRSCAHDWQWGLPGLLHICNHCHSQNDAYEPHDFILSFDKTGTLHIVLNYLQLIQAALYLNTFNYIWTLNFHRFNDSSFRFLQTLRTPPWWRPQKTGRNWSGLIRMWKECDGKLINCFMTRSLGATDVVSFWCLCSWITDAIRMTWKTLFLLWWSVFCMHSLGRISPRLSCTSGCLWGHASSTQWPMLWLCPSLAEVWPLVWGCSQLCLWRTGCSPPLFFSNG